MTRPDGTTLALVAIAVGVWLVAGYFAVTSEAGPETAAGIPRPESSAPSTGIAPPGEGAAGKASSAPQTSEPPTPTRPPAPTKPPGACIGEALGVEGVDFGFVCRQTNPVKASGAIKSALVRKGGGVVTPAMRIWAGLNWYEMAAFAVLRASCCEESDPLVYNFNLACPIDEAINELDDAVRKGDRAAAEEAVTSYTKQARCLDQFGQARTVGRKGPPGAGVAHLRRLLDAMLGAK
ncbi:MAG: hypothetical protein KC731_15780 [Myxococcales bacterium]|nr:hypothetical protein [Myxococcales bacterium]